MSGWAVLCFLSIASAAYIGIEEEGFTVFYKLNWKQKLAFVFLIILALGSFLTSAAYFFLIALYLGTYLA